MKVAVTSQDFRTVTGHAGKAYRFIVFDANARTGVTEIARLDLEPGIAFHHFAGGPHPIDGVEVLLTAGSGDGFVAKMAGRGIRVIRTGQADPRLAVEEVLRGEPTAPRPDADHDVAKQSEDRTSTPSGSRGCRCGSH